MSDYDNMSAGAPMDVLVAEAIMGCNVLYGRCSCTSRGYPHSLHGGPRAVKPYSTSMDAAWEVVEKIKDEHPDDPISRFCIGPATGGGWCACWEIEVEYDPSYCLTAAVSETAALAICRVALIMMEKKVAKERQPLP